MDAAVSVLRPAPPSRPASHLGKLLPMRIRPRGYSLPPTVTGGLTSRLPKESRPEAPAKGISWVTYPKSGPCGRTSKTQPPQKEGSVRTGKPPLSTVHRVPHSLSTLQFKSKPMRAQSLEKPPVSGNWVTHSCRTCGPHTTSKGTLDSLLIRKVIKTQRIEAVLLGKHLALDTY